MLKYKKLCASNTFLDSSSGTPTCTSTCPEGTYGCTLTSSC